MHINFDFDSSIADKGIRRAWIGLTKDSSNDNCRDSACRKTGWIWEDMTPASYVDWYGSEPGAGEYCTTLEWDGWYGKSCRSVQAYICEKGNIFTS